MMKYKQLLSFLAITLLATFIIACKSETSVVTNANNTVLLQLYSDSSTTKLESEFSQYALKEQKIVSRPMHIYLFEFDTTKIADTSLIKKLKQSSLVKEAQQNREVTSRNN